jgi:hypothetical protein
MKHYAAFAGTTLIIKRGKGLVYKQAIWFIDA